MTKRHQNFTTQWETLGKGTVAIMPHKVGKSGFDMPNLQILLPNNQRMAIWLNDQRGTATWQYSQDTVTYRQFLESSLAPGSNDSKPETSEETPIVLTGTMNSKEDDDLPF